MRACLNPIDLGEPEGTERGCSWSFVPFLGKKSCLGPPRILGLASQVTTSGNLLRMPRHSNSVLVRKAYPPPSTVMSISIKQDFIWARSVGLFGPPEEEKGVKHTFFLFLENCFSRAAWNLFDVGNQSVPNHLARDSIRFIPVLFGGGLRHVLTRSQQFGISPEKRKSEAASHL